MPAHFLFCDSSQEKSILIFYFRMIDINFPNAMLRLSCSADLPQSWRSTIHQSCFHIDTMIYFLLSAALVLSANAFLQPRFAQNVMSTGSIVRQELSLSAIKPDLFSGKHHRTFIKHPLVFMFNGKIKQSPGL